MGDARGGGTPKAPADAAIPSPGAKMAKQGPRTRRAKETKKWKHDEDLEEKVEKAEAAGTRMYEN